jgi:hypothetical protein
VGYSWDTVFPGQCACTDRSKRFTGALTEEWRTMAIDPSDLAGLPPNITKVLRAGSGQVEVPPDVADVVISPYGHGDTRHLAGARW